MRYRPIPSSLFAGNRERLKKQLKPNSIALFNSNDMMPTSADGIHSFVQNSDLFYLSGMDQEETVLLLYPDSKEKKNREVLFIKETSDEIAIWDGPRHNRKEAKAISGIETVCWTKEFEKIFRPLVFEADNIYLNTNEHPRADITVETRDMRFLRWCQSAFPLHHYERLAPLMQHLRAIKSSGEITLIQEACSIADKAFRRILNFVRPGVWEFEIEAEIVNEFIRNRSRGPAFQTIVASGAGSCVLHYIQNDRQCRKGDLLLIDFGAEYANYSSDVTRTIPVSGKFSERQRMVYQAVRRVQREAIQMLRPGISMPEYQKEIGSIMESELVGLGLLDPGSTGNPEDETPKYKQYFMHGISHHLGLDVHDLGSKYRKFETGMVLTCEPGIYIREENLGIRIENDILITDGDPVDLTEKIPVEAEEIEALMHS
ncbi:MAG: aminopeptidase P N-terminal domain-containing protein [Desulfobacterales bacterium]